MESVQIYHQVYEYSAENRIRKKALMRMADVLAMFLDRKEKALEYYGRDTGPEARIRNVSGFELTGTEYAGDIRLRSFAGRALFLNELPLEEYLLGVVPKEMSPSWNPEALKAQAVAARSYAYYLVLRSRDKPYDVAATTASQVYGGSGAGNLATGRAVKQTRGGK